MPFPSRKPLNPLGELLSRLLQERGLTDAAFARKAGISAGLLSLIKYRPPPRIPKKLDIKRWGQVLSLSQDDLAELAEAAGLAHTPVRIQELVTQLKKNRKR